MNNNRLSGSLPAAWASNTSFSQLAAMELRNNRLSGAPSLGCWSRAHVLAMGSG